MCEALRASLTSVENGLYGILIALILHLSQSFFGIVSLAPDYNIIVVLTRQEPQHEFMRTSCYPSGRSNVASFALRTSGGQLEKTVTDMTG